MDLIRFSPLKRIIEKQLLFNRGKNLFYSGDENKMDFIQEIEVLQKELKILDTESLNSLIDYTVDQALIELCRVNQFYHFDVSAKQQLRKIYLDLNEELAKVTNREENTIIAAFHYRRLQQWLGNCNPFALNIYPEEKSVAKSVMCAEYSPELQISVLGLDPEMIMQPVLDVGCGSDARLVHFLANRGIEVHGIDRHVHDSFCTTQADWLDFQFELNQWGTIISHLGFSNHFVHQHHRTDGNFVDYARKYMQMLNSLKEGGRFFYAPELPFIEIYLDQNRFSLTKRVWSSSGSAASSVQKKAKL